MFWNWNSKTWITKEKEEDKNIYILNLYSHLLLYANKIIYKLLYNDNRDYLYGWIIQNNKQILEKVLQWWEEETIKIKKAWKSHPAVYVYMPTTEKTLQKF